MTSGPLTTAEAGQVIQSADGGRGHRPLSMSGTTAYIRSVAFLLILSTLDLTRSSFSLVYKLFSPATRTMPLMVKRLKLETIDALDHDGPSIHSVLSDGPSTWPHAPAFQ
jgi:hypothetical protein